MKTDDAKATHSPLQRLPAKLFPLPSLRGVPVCTHDCLVKNIWVPWCSRCNIAPYCARLRWCDTFGSVSVGVARHWREGLTLCFHFRRRRFALTYLDYQCTRNLLLPACWSGLFLRISETLQSGRCHTHCGRLHPDSFVSSSQRELFFLKKGYGILPAAVCLVCRQNKTLT